jgi:hypothetical protein
MKKLNPISITLIAAGVLLLIMSYSEIIKVYYKSSKEYQVNVSNDSITVFDGQRAVGTVKLEGQLDSLITNDNQ